MKLLLTPIGKALGVLLIVAVIAWVAGELFDFPLIFVIGTAILSAVITAHVDVQKNMTLKTYFRAIHAWVNDSLYLYELDVRIPAGPETTIAPLIELINHEYVERAKLGVIGSNYIQVRLLEPPRSVLIKVQPDASQIAFDLDDEGTDQVVEPRIISIDLVDPVELHYRKSDSQSVRNTFDALRELANEIGRATGGGVPYFTVTVNRTAKGIPLKHPQGPGPGGTILDNANVRIRRDSKALQLQSKSSSSIVQHLSENIADLEPVA